VRCLASHKDQTHAALLLERCTPGEPLSMRPEPEQDEVIAGLLRRLWAHEPPPGNQFEPLETMWELWAGAPPPEPLGKPHRPRLLCTDLHAGNVLSARREPWLMIDPKPYIGDAAYDVVQHMLNCPERLAADPVGLATRMAELTGVDPERVRLWLQARCAQEAHRDPSLREAVRRLSP
jgi:streptomycin 6-kinase